MGRVVDLYQDAEKVRQPLKRVCLVRLVCLVCRVCLVFWLNETNQIDQTNQTDQMNQTDRACATRADLRNSSLSK